jgi:peptide deformylase
MTTRNDIINLPNPHLRETSVRVGLVDDSIKQLVKDMKDATLDWENHRPHEFGIALAAIQIDVLKRVVIVRNDFENKSDKSFSVFINPEIVKLDGEMLDDFEGCLSVKDVYGKVPRYSRAKIKALDLDGKEFRMTAEGFLARVFQHETDHTVGKLFVDHISDDKNAFYHLADNGKLEKLDYEDVKKTDIFRN